jgi:hypothetical protein
VEPGLADKGLLVDRAHRILFYMDVVAAVELVLLAQMAHRRVVVTEAQDQHPL